MARLVLLDSSRTKRGVANSNLAGHRGSTTEGEAAHKLLAERGYPHKRKAHNQYESACPFHEGEGEVPHGKSGNFYLDATSSKYECKSASCGERGNLTTLERYFGVDGDDSFAAGFKSKNDELVVFEQCLVPALRKPFYNHGLTDLTIERFRFGYQIAHVDESGRMIPGRYVIPYLDGRRPRAFRYYMPDMRERDSDGNVKPGQPNYDARWKYTWEPGAETTLFNAQDAIGDKDGIAYIAEGELKCALLVQLGYAAVAVPGAGQWKDEFQAAFTHARKIIVCYDNDNPAFHIYDKPAEGRLCIKCTGKGLDRCAGHNPGQEAALARVDQLGWRAKNVVLPLAPDKSKTDINDFFVRDGGTNADFAELCTGKRVTPFKVSTLAEIRANPPKQANFLIEQGILPVGGRLLVAGKAKIGKSLIIENMALSLSAGIPFLGRFAVDHPTRTLLLDREMSKASLFERLDLLIADRPGYQAAEENMMIDHDHLLRLDQPNALDTLLQLVQQNGAEVVILDTAYKFLGGDVESSSALMKAFAVLDKVIHETGCSIVLTHHLRKGRGATGKENSDVADPDAVVGSFLWTGWPNATILLNYLNRSVENPYDAVCTFTAFRDHAAPEPLALYRGKESVSYSKIEDYSHDSDNSTPVQYTKPTTDVVAAILLEMCPVSEADFVHAAAATFGVTIETMRPFYLDVMSTGNFSKTGNPPILKYRYDIEPSMSWEAEHNMPERPAPVGMDVEMFDAAALA